MNKNLRTKEISHSNTPFGFYNLNLIAGNQIERKMLDKKTEDGDDERTMKMSKNLRHLICLSHN
jgi:hypothetical protein